MVSFFIDFLFLATSYFSTFLLYLGAPYSYGGNYAFLATSRFSTFMLNVTLFLFM